MIVKTKFYCKTSSSIGVGFSSHTSGPNSHPSINISNAVPTTWSDTFIAGKWYDGEYETWSWEDGYKVNGGWRRYWAINERGEKSEISRAVAGVVFEFNLDNIRDEKINEILK